MFYLSIELKTRYNA